MTTGRYALRLPESLKIASKHSVAADDTTMNQFFVVTIVEKIRATKRADFFERRSASASGTKAEKAWGVARSVPRAFEVVVNPMGMFINKKNSYFHIRSSRATLDPCALKRLMSTAPG
jgi:hypothetical protein